MDKEEIFRNTKNYYLNNNIGAHPELIKFTTKYAGSEILDIGCATGIYLKKLNELGYSCTGIDINPKYIKSAQINGVKAYQMSAENLDFPDNSFDSVILFEVLEHVQNPISILGEAIRVARKNILISVPDSTNFIKLKDQGITYEHMLDLDHVNFFSENDLKVIFSELVRNGVKNYHITPKDPMWIGSIFLPWWIRYPISLLYKLKIIKNDVYYRLYAVIEL